MLRHIALCTACWAFLVANTENTVAQGFKFLEVTVVDPDGQPMADVPVEISVDNTRFPMPTNADGKVAINVPAEENSEVAVRVRYEGYTAMAVGWRGGKEIPPAVTIPLRKGVTFGGIVHDEQGQPVEGVKVSGEMVYEKRYGLVHDGEVAPFLDGELAKTDKDGRWQCTQAPDVDAEFQLNFSHPSYLNTVAEYDANGASREELISLQEVVVLKNGVVLTGTVVDPDRLPIPHAFVEAMAGVDGDFRGSQTFSDRKGKFQTFPIPIGKTTLSVVADGFAPLMRRVNNRQAAEPLDLQLDAGRLVAIRVVNEAGEPLAGAEVSVTDWHYPGNRLELDGNYNTDAQGIWRWGHAPDGELTYLFSHPGYMEAKHKLIAGNELQTVTLGPPVKITGKVIDKATREPIEKFKLMGIATIDCGVDKKCLIVFNAKEPSTNDEYVFLAGLLCHEFHVSCSADGYQNANSRTITPDEDQVHWDFELEREDAKSEGK